MKIPTKETMKAIVFMLQLMIQVTIATKEIIDTMP